LSTNVAENYDMTDISKKDQVSPFQGNDKECASQILSCAKDQEQVTPRKPKNDINGLSNQQVLNYLLQKIDRKDKESEQPVEDSEMIIKNKITDGAVFTHPAKSASMIPEETDENVNKGTKMCQSEPTRAEAGPSPN